MKIFLVRHGEAAAPWQEADDPGLSERGQQQALATAELLLARAGAGIQLISSPMRRARETAQPLAEALGREVAVVDAFREIPTPVELVDRPSWLRSVARQRWSEQHQIVRDWRDALWQELRQIREPAVVFTHFMVLNAIVGELRAEDRVVCYLPDNASVTTLHREAEVLQLVELGRQLRTGVH